MKRWPKIVLFGFLMWLIPFIVSFAFYTPQGELRGDIFFFKTVMLIVSLGFGTWLMVKYFRTVEGDSLREACLVGSIWVFISWFLDIVLLLPMSGMHFGEYFIQIGARYVGILIVALGIGAVKKS